MGRMVVEPGSAPQWIDNYKRGRGWRRPYGSHKNYFTDKQKEGHIREEIKEVLWKKVENVQNFTDEQKGKVKNTLKFQINIFSKVIIEQASEIVDFEMENMSNDYFDAVQESKETKKITEMYYSNLREKAMDIALDEYNISDKFDIEKAGKKEKEVYGRVKRGEISPKEAQRILEEPILFENVDKRRNQDIIRAYKRHETKSERKNETRENEGNIR